MLDPDPNQSARPDPADPAERRWRELLDALEIADLTTSFLEQLGAVDDYAEPVVPLAQIRLDADESFERLIAALAANDPEPTIPIATRVGVTRARAGIPLPSLMTAIRLDFSVLWDHLLALRTPADEPLLLERANTVWHIVDTYVRQTQQAYMLEERRMTHEAESLQRALVAELLAELRPSARRVEEIAERLGLDPDAAYTVAFGTGDAVPDLRVEVATCERHGHAVLAMYRGGGLIVVRPDAPHQQHSSMRRLRVGLVEPVAGLANVAEATLLAAELADLFAPDEDDAMTPLRGWTRLVRQRTSGTDLEQLFDLDALLDGCGRTERGHLVESVRSYLRTGNVSASAAELYCHRNTVTNRLRRFAELTGIDVTVPEQAARVVVAWT